MIKLISISSIFILLTLNLMAQSCDCLENFNYTVSKVSKNYAGYNDKVNLNKKSAFTQFTNNLLSKSKKTTDIDSCYVLLRTWTNYFKDHHLKVQLDWRYREKYPEKLSQLSKQFPKFKNLPPPAKDSLAKETSLKQLSDKTLLITLPSFEWEEKKKIDRIIKKNQVLLEKFPHWIIDLRGNMGGNDLTYGPFIPYLYTNSIGIFPSEYWASEDNIKIYEQQLEDQSVSEESKKYIAEIVTLMKRNIGSFINPVGKDTMYVKLDSIFEYPKKVAFLIDRNTASSAESLLLTAKQSKKVTVFGENSYGILDYANSQYFDILCAEYNLVIPISRSTRLPRNPIDNIGIEPDILIDNSEKQKINLIRLQLEK
ncbi:Peptidase family S41 [Chryseobacterium formosense]|nr:S41 family peptidase [Chryseobacterium formosense]SFT45839.1 Peptidase family S41 [Chryseobacterium formosense]